MIRILALILTPALLLACQSTPRNAQPVFPRGAQGQYVRPAYLNPAPVPRIPATDVCQSQLFQGLVGQPEGAIFIPGLPGTKRVIKPAFDEGFDYDAGDTFGQEPTYLEVRDYLPDQSLYAPSIRTPGSLLAVTEFNTNRLTIELDIEGYVQEVRCG